MKYKRYFQSAEQSSEIIAYYIVTVKGSDQLSGQLDFWKISSV